MGLGRSEGPAQRSGEASRARRFSGHHAKNTREGSGQVRVGRPQLQESFCGLRGLSLQE